MCRKQLKTNLIVLGFLLFFVFSVQGQVWETVVESDFETDFPTGLWERSYDPGVPPASRYTWGRSNFVAYSGEYSIWCARKNQGTGPDLVAGSGYANDMDARASYGPFDLTNSDEGRLFFYLWTTFGSGSDFLEIQAEFGQGWQVIYERHINTDGWEFIEVDLAAFGLIDQKFVSIRFRFLSDNNNVTTGVFIDDVLIRKHIIGRPDLQLTDLVFNPPSVTKGEVMDVAVTVDNAGDNLARQTTVDFYLSPDADISTMDDQFIGRAAVPELVPGSNYPFTQFFTVPLVLDAGPYYVGAIVDRDDGADEWDETNNLAVSDQTITLVDPVGWDIILDDSFEEDFPLGLWSRGADNGQYTWGRSYNRASDGDVSLWCAEENLGGAPRINPGGGYAHNMEGWAAYGPFDLFDCAEVTLSLEMWRKLGATIDRAEIQANYGQGWRGFEYTTNTEGWEYIQLDLTEWPFEDLVGQQNVWIRLFFVSDGGNSSTGVFVDNLLLRRKFAQPDLVCSALTVTPAEVEPGGKLLVNATLTNLDNTGADTTCTIDYYLSLDANISAIEDVMLGSDAVDQLAAGSSVDFSNTFTLDANFATGTYYVGAIVDKDNIVVENAEDNNTTVADEAVVVSEAVQPLIVVDGERDDFWGTLTGPDDGYLQFRSYAWSDNGVPDDDNDLSAKLWAAWDLDNLYVYTQVTDNIISANTANVYETDCLELKLDPVPTEEANSIWDTRLTALGAADVSSGQPTDDLNNVDAAKKQFARKVTTDGYNLELSVAWEAIVGATETVAVGTGNIFGLGIGIHDNDVDHREASLQWAAVMLDAMWNTPAYLGTVKFLEGNKLQFIPTNNITGETNEIPYDGSDYERTGIDDIATIPQEFGLYQNYPNPFNPATQITYTIPERGMVKLAVFDMLGKQVAVLVEEIKQPGFYTVEFDASHLSSGIYFYKLQAGMKSGTHKMLLVK